MFSQVDSDKPDSNSTNVSQLPLKQKWGSEGFHHNFEACKSKVAQKFA